MRRSTLIPCLCVLALLSALPAVAGSADSAPAPAPALALDTGACPDVPATVVDFDAGAAPAIGERDPQPAQLGCTASYNCVHGTIVSCSSPFIGTCSASGGGCGSVTCNGQTTWCPGQCAGDHHCARFCGWENVNSYCDWAGCCECVP